MKKEIKKVITFGKMCCTSIEWEISWWKNHIQEKKYDKLCSKKEKLFNKIQKYSEKEDKKWKKLTKMSADLFEIES